jgi:hypothetical protein
MLTHSRLSTLLDVRLPYPFVGIQLHVLRIHNRMLSSILIANLRYRYFQSLLMMIYSLEAYLAGSKISLGSLVGTFHESRRPLPREAIQLVVVMIEDTTEVPA